MRQKRKKTESQSAKCVCDHHVVREREREKGETHRNQNACRDPHGRNEMEER